MMLAGHELAQRLLQQIDLCTKYQIALRQQKRLEAVQTTLQAAYELGVQHGRTEEQHAQTQAAPEGAAAPNGALRC